MTTLYNCRHDGDEFRITKFDSELNVESSYRCTTSECECPAGERPICRHRQMLPKFISAERVGTDWFYDFDRGGWVQIALDEPAMDLAEAIRAANIPGVQVFNLAETSPAELHDALEKAVGEPAQRPQSVSLRRRGW